MYYGDTRCRDMAQHARPAAATTFVLTAKELAGVLRCDAWRIRRYLADVKPPSRGNRRTRLYAVSDAALVSLAIALEREGVSAWTRRAVVANHVGELRDALVSDAPLAFAVHGVRGKVIAETDAARLPVGAIVVSLSPIRRGLSDAIARIRRDEPTIHQFNRRIPVETAWQEARSIAQRASW